MSKCYCCDRRHGDIAVYPVPMGRASFKLCEICASVIEMYKRRMAQ